MAVAILPPIVEPVPVIDEDVNKVNVFFKVGGKTVCLWLDLEKSSVGTVKGQIQQHGRKQHSLPSSVMKDNIFLVCNGKPLADDEAPLSLYSVTANSTVHVSVRKPGGCFVCSCSILFIIMLAVLSSCCTCGLSLAIVPILLPFLFVLPLFCL